MGLLTDLIGGAANAGHEILSKQMAQEAKEKEEERLVARQKEMADYQAGLSKSQFDYQQIANQAQQTFMDKLKAARAASDRAQQVQEVDAEHQGLIKQYKTDELRKQYEQDGAGMGEDVNTESVSDEELSNTPNPSPEQINRMRVQAEVKKGYGKATDMTALDSKDATLTARQSEAVMKQELEREKMVGRMEVAAARSASSGAKAKEGDLTDTQKAELLPAKLRLEKALDKESQTTRESQAEKARQEVAAAQEAYDAALAKITGKSTKKDTPLTAGKPSRLDQFKVIR